MGKRGFAWLLLLLMLFASVPAGAYQYVPAGPTGALGVSRPVIGVRLTLGAGETVSSVQMTLDGQSVPAAWDPATSMVRYVPPAPLAPGVHRVRLTVSVKGVGYSYQPLVQEYSFTVAQGALAVLPDADAEGRRAVQYVTALRAQAGLSGVQWDRSLGAASAAHAQYLIVNPQMRQSDPHHERAGDQGFTGYGPGDRARYFGDNGGVGEVINFETGAEEGIDGWMESLYHRIPIVAPGSTRLGYGVSTAGTERVQVMKMGDGGTLSTPVIWPPAGATGVTTGWSGLESPDPLRLYGGWKGPVGYTVTVTWPGRPKLAITTLRLTGPDGRQVPAYTYTPANDNHLDETVALIPQKPLAPYTTYEALFSGTVDGKAWSQRWRFTTGGGMKPMLRSRQVSTRGGVIEEIEVAGYSFPQGARVFLGGLPVQSLVIESDTAMRFRPPVGFRAGVPVDLLVVTPQGHEVVWPLFFKGTETFTAPATQPAFRGAPLFIDGVRQPVGALMAGDAALVPESVLGAIGGSRERIASIDRIYWTVGGKIGDFIPGRAVFRLNGGIGIAGLPARVEKGTLFVPGALVQSLAGGRVLVLRDMGGHWAEVQVGTLVSKGIISGYDDWTFRPAAQVTRAAFVKMLVTARGLSPAPGQTGGFADAAGHWVSTQGWIGAAAKAGIVKPAEYPSARFEPDRQLTRQEMAVMIVRALGLDAQALARSVTSGLVGGRQFSDVASWTAPGYIALAVEQGIITGYQEADGSYTFRPARLATRAEAAVMVGRMLGK